MQARVEEPAGASDIVGQLFVRHPGNPILTARNWPYVANSVFNPGATQLPDGTTLLLVRVEDPRGISHFTIARSTDGVTNWVVESEPALAPLPARHPEEIWGIEDPRIVWLEEAGRYAITYVAYSRRGPLVSLALTEDFNSFERWGPIMPPEDKDAALFPRRFDGRWALIHRPTPAIDVRADVWLSFSPDLKHWGDHVILLEAREGPYWDAGRIGLSTPPIETPEGWLIVYHGVKRTPSSYIYRQGLALLDLEDPRIVLRRGERWVFRPEEPYELTGDVQDIVFPSGAVYDARRDMLRLYYGAADTCVALATAQVSDLLSWLRTQATPGQEVPQFMQPVSPPALVGGNGQHKGVGPAVQWSRAAHRRRAPFASSSRPNMRPRESSLPTDASE